MPHAWAIDSGIGSVPPAHVKAEPGTLTHTLSRKCPHPPRVYSDLRTNVQPQLGDDRATPRQRADGKRHGGTEWCWHQLLVCCVLPPVNLIAPHDTGAARAWSRSGIAVPGREAAFAP